MPTGHPPPEYPTTAMARGSDDALRQVEQRIGRMARAVGATCARLRAVLDMAAPELEAGQFHPDELREVGTLLVLLGTEMTDQADTMDQIQTMLTSLVER